MARVHTHAVKQASLNLANFVEKKQIDVNQADIESILSSVPGMNMTNAPAHQWEKTDAKPYTIEGMIEQIKSMFDVGKEVESWSVKYYGPAQKNEKGKAIEPDIRIPPIEKGLGGRFIVLFGTREVPTLEIAMGSSGAENQYMMLSGDCMYLKITICPVLNIVFSNNFSEKLAPRKGFREMIVKKNPFTRHVFIIDAHVSIEAVATKVKKELIGVTSEEVAEKLFKESDVVAELASDKSEKKE